MQWHRSQLFAVLIALMFGWALADWLYSPSSTGDGYGWPVTCWSVAGQGVGEVTYYYQDIRKAKNSSDYQFHVWRYTFNVTVIVWMTAGAWLQISAGYVFRFERQFSMRGVMALMGAVAIVGTKKAVTFDPMCAIAAFLASRSLIDLTEQAFNRWSRRREQPADGAR